MTHEIFIGEGQDVGAEEVIEEIQSLQQPVYVKIIGLYVVVSSISIPDEYVLMSDM